MSVRRAITLLAVLTASIAAVACGGGGGGSPTPTTHTVTLSWAPNRETGVNSAGGGYEVAISGMPSVDVPYVSGSGTPTTTTVSLLTGNYTVSVRAYAAMDPTGGTARHYSAASKAISVVVPY